MSVAIPEGSVAFDSGVLIELIEGTEKGMAVLEALTNSRLTPHASWVNLVEAEYIVCRKVGQETARRSIKALLDSAFVTVEEDPLVHEAAARLKYERSMSIADCYTFAVAEVTSSVPLFASEEAEIVREMKKRPFDVPPVFLS